MFDLMEKYGVTFDPESLTKLRKVYVDMVETLRGTAEKAESEGASLLSQLGEIVASDEEVTEALTLIKSVIREAVFQALDEMPSISIPLVDLLQEVKSEAMAERDYQVSKVKREMAPVKSEVPSDFLESVTECKELGALIRQLWPLLKEHKGTKTKEFKSAFPVKDSKTDGIIPDLPKAPSVPGEDASPAGRGAQVRRLRFQWNGEDIPEGTWPSDVAHDLVSDRSVGFVVDVRAIQDAVEKSGQVMFSETPWHLDFPTGKLTGWLPKKK